MSCLVQFSHIFFFPIYVILCVVFQLIVVQEKVLNQVEAENKKHSGLTCIVIADQAIAAFGWHIMVSYPLFFLAWRVAGPSYKLILAVCGMQVH